MTRSEPTTDELVAWFAQPSGFRRYFGLRRGELAREAHELFSAADSRGAVRSTVLDQREYDGSRYVIKAIATDGELDDAERDELADQASSVPLGTVRFEGMVAATLPRPVGSVSDASDVHAISRLERGIIVYPVTKLSKRSVSTFALWARIGEDFFVLPLDDRRIERR